MPYRYSDAVAARYLAGHGMEEAAGPVNISTAARFLRLNGLTRSASETFQIIRQRRAARAAALQYCGLPVAAIARCLDLSMRQTARYPAATRQLEPLT